MGWNRKPTLYGYALLVMVLPGWWRAEACRERVTIYLDLSDSMVASKNSEDSPFATAMAVIKKLSQPNYIGLTEFVLRIKTFDTDFRQQLQISVHEGRPEEFESLQEKLARLEKSALSVMRERVKSKDPKGTDLVKVVDDMRDTAQDEDWRDIFVIASDLIHDMRQIRKPGMLRDGWEEDARAYSLDEKLSRIFSDTKKGRALIILLASNPGEASFQGIVKNRLMKSAGVRCKAYSLKDLKLAGTLAAELTPFSLELKRYYNKGIATYVPVVQKQTCSTGVNVDEVKFQLWGPAGNLSTKCRGAELAEPKCDPIPMPESEGYAVALYRSMEVSLYKPFKTEPFLKLVGATVKISGKRVTVKPRVKGQPPDDRIKMTLAAPSVDMESDDIAATRLSAVNIESPVDLDDIPIKDGPSKVNLCGHYGPQKVALRFTSPAMKPSESLELRKEESIDNGSHEFFEHVAIPGGVLCFLIFLYTLLSPRVTLRVFVEVFEVGVAIAALTFGILHDTTRFGSRLEDWANEYSPGIATALMILAAILVGISSLRGMFVREVGPETLKWRIEKGRLASSSRTPFLLRWGFSLAALAFGAWGAYYVFQNPTHLDECTFQVEGGGSLLAANAESLSKGE